MPYVSNVPLVKNLLQDHFRIASWAITVPHDGMQKACYIAQSGVLKVFVKFDVPVEPLRRLGEIGVAPRVIASGIQGGISYVVQEYMVGSYPDWQWFADHLAPLARFVLRYHSDTFLAELLTRNVGMGYEEHIAQEIADLEARFTTLGAGVLHTPEITEAFDTLKGQAKLLHPVELVPIHTDPNTKNILLVDGRLYMVDWDNIRLSDPMQDVGLLLWWYVAKQRWQAFFQSYGLSMDEQLTDRIFWWAARTSLAIAFWLIEHHFDCEPFLKDFVAAVRKESNPHAVFGE